MFSINACDHCGRSDEVESMNITHNLGVMARAAGIYDIVWRPEENGIERAGQIVGRLNEAILNMSNNPQKYKEHDEETGWGTYEQFVPWLRKLRDVCEQYPNAKIEASR